jgi:Flp pilus assembly protein TadG
MLIFGMFEFGRMLMVQQVLTNGARSGSRVAVIDGATSSEVISTVREYLNSGSIDESDVAITLEPPNLAETDTGDPITVRISVPFEDVSWLPSPWFLEDKTLTAHSTMRRE